MRQLFHHSQFFDLSDCPFKKIFEDLEFVWEVLPKIGPFLEQFLEPGIYGQVMEGAFLLGNDIYLGPEAVVEPGALIKGPAYIGRGSIVRHGAYVRGNVLVGENSVIGHATEIKNSIMLNQANAAHFNYVGDSVLGNRVNLGAGTRLANLKNIEGEVVVRLEGKEFPTGLRKFGAILGDDAKTGCNVVTNPGTILGRGAIIYPCLSVRGFIPEFAVVKPKEPYVVERTR
ncbi:MAG: glucose-1-phosphate thymidylyltransferase [Coprothermobacterota bacterium]|jgi:NDP-sugar pyrophosphorylase family protein|nr:glucose-1-phosphate thymidylyltransferase [Caldisericota bacterium]MDI6868743.1 glucose-1-phosphate thymidylyltransferase [Coprothermobacterota bacterium]